MFHLLAAALLASSGNLLFESYFGAQSDPSAISKVVILTSPTSTLESGMTLAGTCYEGLKTIPCCYLAAATCLPKLAPWMAATSRIFFGLVCLGSFSVLLFDILCGRNWETKPLRSLRIFTVAVNFMAILAGTATIAIACVSVCSSMLGTPETEDIMDLKGIMSEAKGGWAMIVVILLTSFTALQVVAFGQLSSEALNLDPEIELSEESAPLIDTADAKELK